MHFFFNRSNGLIQRASFWGLVLFLMSGQAKAIPEKDTGNLGEIRQSILSLRDFQKIYGEGWVTLDGRNITESDLHRERLWEGNHLPDARGDFLRCFDDDGPLQKCRSNPTPTNPQETLNNSVRVSENSSRRVWANKITGEFDVFDEHTPGNFHGHSRAWGELTETIKSSL